MYLNFDLMGRLRSVSGDEFLIKWRSLGNADGIYPHLGSCIGDVAQSCVGLDQMKHAHMWGKLNNTGKQGLHIITIISFGQP